MKLLLMADTHVPRRARDLPEQLWQAVDEADVVVHAGDWVCVELVSPTPTYWSSDIATSHGTRWSHMACDC